MGWVNSIFIFKYLLKCKDTMLKSCKLNPFKKLPYLTFTEQENYLKRSTILAKEEINLAIYVINETKDLKELDYTKNLKLESIWTTFRKSKIWRQRNES